MGISTWFRLTNVIARLDALAFLGRREDVERESASLLEQPGVMLEPFARRALGLVREDDELVQQALQRFEELGLDWYAAETRRLVAKA
jgi:hypothetical protein